MSLSDEYNFEDLINEAERLVLDELERQLRTLPPGADLRGEDTVLDVAAYALNHVRPRYRVNLLGRLYAQSVDDQYAHEIENAVSEAIRKVSSNPDRTRE